MKHLGSEGNWNGIISNVGFGRDGYGKGCTKNWRYCGGYPG